MAQQMLNLAGNLPPEILQQQQALTRQQQLANLLTQQGLQQPQGQMVSGRYVAPSFFQYAAPLAQLYAGKGIGEKAEKEQLDLANRYAKMQQEAGQRIANALLGTPAIQEPDIPTETYETVKGKTIPAVAGSPQLALAEALKDPTGIGKSLIPTLIERVSPKPVAPTNEMQNYQFLKESGQLPKGMTFLGYQTYLKTVDNKPEKPPVGYRFMPDGSLEAIKGGPADLKSQAKIAGAEDVDKVIVDLRDKYNKLFEGGGITDPSLRVGSNLAASASQSPVGQFFGRALSTQNQSYRNQITTTRPLLMSAIMKATGMSAKQIDSNAELKLWLSTATDPNLDYETNMNALSNLENLFGTAALNKQPISNQPTSNQPTTNQSNAPKATAVPKVGDVQQGYRYKGGNPALQSSWEKI